MKRNTCIDAEISLLGEQKMRLGIWIVHRLVLSIAIITGVLVSGIYNPSVATAATYYVATNGSDAGLGTQSAPFRTIVKGLSVMGTGDTLYIRGGTYVENINSNIHKIPTGTSWTNAPQIKAYPGEIPVLKPSSGTGVLNLASFSDASSYLIQYLIFDGLIFDGINLKNSGVASLNGTQYVRIQNCELRNSANGQHPNASYMVLEMGTQKGPARFNEILRTKIYNAGRDGHGAYIRGENNLFDRIEVYNNGQCGMQLYSSGGGVNNNIVRNSIFHGNGVNQSQSCGGLIVGSGDGNTIYNNISYGNINTGISVSSGATNSKVYNNTVYNNQQGGLVVSSSSGSIIRNNILYANGSSYGNLYDDTGATKSNNLVTNPLFVDSASANFRLQSGSPAIDKGMIISIVTGDFDGNSRPNGAGYDIGAHEFRQLIAPPIASPTSFRLVSR